MFRVICLRNWRFWKLANLAFLVVMPLTVKAQQPAVVQPGAPGHPTRSLPSNIRASLPPVSSHDIDFMKGMIMHHSQAVEMTALIESRTKNKEIRLLGSRISQSQSDEMRFMVRWLDARGKIAPPRISEMREMSVGGAGGTEHRMLMPGMLSRAQMDDLKKASGHEFDRLFLTGMIQHHNGALVMVKELFAAPGTGQDAELFNFVTDVDSGQRAEIKIMQNLLGEYNVEEKP